MEGEALQHRFEAVSAAFGTARGNNLEIAEGLDYGRYTMGGASVLSVSLLPEERGVRFTLRVGEKVQNIGGNLHGGAIATLVDVLTSLAIHIYDKSSRASVSTNLSIDYIAAAPLGTELIAEAKVKKIGRTLAFTDMEIRNKNDNTLYAKGSHTKFMLDAPVTYPAKAPSGNQQETTKKKANL